MQLNPAHQLPSVDSDDFLDHRMDRIEQKMGDLSQDPTSVSRIVPVALSGVNKNRILGILLFGSTARGEQSAHSDMDVGLVYDMEMPPGPFPVHWDLFCWSRSAWERGFALQLSLSREALILYDPQGLISSRLDYLRREVLPAWERFLTR